MKFGYCLSAFIVGCFMTVFMRANAPQSATAKVATQATFADFTSAQQDIAGTVIEMGITKRVYGTTADGREVTQYLCQNANGYSLEMIDFGAIVTAFRAPDKVGNVENITLGCTDIEGYEACTSYFGSTVGRFCNRIAKGKFSIDGTEYTLDTNNGENHLHGGKVGFDKRIWKSEQLITVDSVGVRFKLISEDGDQGYPGTLEVTVDYVLNNANELKIDFTASTDKTTPVNLTNHNYWNLGGASSGKILDHELQIESTKYLPVDATSIPTGELRDVKGTPFDFSTSKKIGRDVEQLGGDPVGYDHCFALNSQSGGLALAATVRCEKSGRKMEIHTTQPGIQFYTGNFLNGQPSSGGFDQHSAFCLETQHYPDAPNQPKFATTLLQPGQTYRQTTVHKFSVE